MENFTIYRRYLKLCNELRSVIKCMKTAFYRPDYQKLLMCGLIKRLGRAFVSKHAADPLNCSAELFKYSDELLKHWIKLLRIYEETRNSAESLKRSAACLCYSTSHAVLISHGEKTFSMQL